jgi:hypothetical protein
MRNIGFNFFYMAAIAFEELKQQVEIFSTGKESFHQATVSRRKMAHWCRCQPYSGEMQERLSFCFESER